MKSKINIMEKYLEEIEIPIEKVNTVEKVLNPANNRIFILLNDYEIKVGDRREFEHSKDDLLISINDDQEYEEKNRHYYAQTGANSVEEFIELLIKTIESKNCQVSVEEYEDFLLNDDEYYTKLYLEKNGIEILEENEIVINMDFDRDMQNVFVNGEEIMEGNSHDFYPLCYGLVLPDFKGSDELAQLFDDLFKSSGKNSTIKKNTDWNYNEK